MAKPRIFISFDYDNDRDYKNALLMWDANKEFDFEFYDGSLREAINSMNALYIKRQIKPLIEKATHVLCIVGRYAGNNDWINWEVQTGADAGKTLIGVKLDRTNVSPPALLNNGASWAMSFTFDAIKKAVNDTIPKARWL